MAEEFEYEELLRAANPVDDARLADPAVSVFGQQLLERIVATGAPARRPKGRRQRRVHVYLVAVLAAVGGGAGVSYAIARNQPNKRVLVSCYGKADLQSDFVVLAAGNRSPVAGCQAMWARGEIVGEPAAAHKALDACLLAPGGVGVFPRPATSGDACGLLHLPLVTPVAPPAPPTTAAASASINDASDTIVQALSESCLDADQAKARITQALEASGLSNWTVTTATPFSASRPCASPGFDEVHEQVLIIAIPPKP